MLDVGLLVPTEIISVSELIVLILIVLDVGLLVANDPSRCEGLES